VVVVLIVSKKLCHETVTRGHTTGVKVY